MSRTQASLLTVFADGQERDGWAFGSGTLSWAKKNGFVELTQLSPSRYRITDAGRKAYALVAKETGLKP